MIQPIKVDPKIDRNYHIEEVYLSKYIANRRHKINKLKNANALRVGLNANPGYGMQLKKFKREIESARQRLKVLRMNKLVSPDKYIGTT